MNDLKTGTDQGHSVVPEPAAKLVPEAVKVLKQQIRRIFPAGRFAYLEHCLNRGIDARELGFCRVSPFYEDLEADLYWFSGYDGLSFRAAMQIHSGHMESPPHEDSN